MADEIQRKRVTLHPVKEDGSLDMSINLYPKTFIDGIVDRQGEQVEVATKEELNEKQDVLTAGENITIEDNVISATGGKSFKEYTTLEPIEYEGSAIIFDLSEEEYDDILDNRYPLIKIIDCEYPYRVALELQLAKEGHNETEAFVRYVENDVNVVDNTPTTVVFELNRYIDLETQEKTYMVYCDGEDLIVSTHGERYTAQRIYQVKEFYNDANESRTNIGFGRVEVHSSGDASSLEIESDRGKDELTKMPGLSVNGSYEESENKHDVSYSITFPDTRDSSLIQGKGNVVALEETIPTFAIIANPITNLNGRVLTEFTYEEVAGLYSYYDIKHTNSQTHEDEILTVDLARLYMKRMAGTSFVPEYNYKNPRNSLFITAAGEFLKPQFDAQNGLRLYKIPSPFALKAETTKLYSHYINSSDGTIDEVMIISPSSLPITSDVNLHSLLNKGYWTHNRDTGYVYYFDTTGSDAVAFTEVYLLGVGGKVESFTENVDFNLITDTVTPL